ncbi:Delta(24(24(1)))-sterol reductase like protein [Acephala macrosclerotiorum]|nr:Delta(24(24(1)))-sterol reductase like protein [Acephala macrosclerotiorum]
MSERYSLRQTPKKTEHLGYVPTPGTTGARRVNRRKSQFPEEDGDDSSSATDTSTSKVARKVSSRKTSGMAKEVLSNGSADSDIEIATNGYANGHTNGEAVNGNGYGTIKANAPAVAEQQKVVDGWEVGKDPKIDYSSHFDFGGSWGVSAMIIGFPTLMYYMWIGATFYDGKFPTPAAGESFLDFMKHCGNLVYEYAFPGLFAWEIYWGYLILEGAFYCLLPGVYGYGKPLAHEGGKQLKYYCSGVWSFYTTIILMAGLHWTGIFPLYNIIDQFGPILSVAIISGFGVSIVAYISALLRGAQHRMTGYPIYDFFMGAELNPRLFGILDFKMFFEVRIPWYILFGLSCATAARQYENYGYVSGEVWFMVMAHFLYANACSKGEELIITTWDMYYEKWGFMLIFWNLAGVPLSYCHSTIYLANHLDTITSYPFRTPFLWTLFGSYLFVYWVWDTTNSQKNRFRAAERGTLVPRKSFPQLPWQEVKNPRVIKTKTGDSILADGWYGKARKIHYTCDLFFATSWGLITGFSSPFPWFYPVFFACMIVHRAYRDIQRCKLKYGESWTEYEKTVPYLFIPYVF